MKYHFISLLVSLLLTIGNLYSQKSCFEKIDTKSVVFLRNSMQTVNKQIPAGINSVDFLQYESAIELVFEVPDINGIYGYGSSSDAFKFEYTVSFQLTAYSGTNVIPGVFQNETLIINNEQPKAVYRKTVPAINNSIPVNIDKVEIKITDTKETGTNKISKLLKFSYSTCYGYKINSVATDLQVNTNTVPSVFSWFDAVPDETCDTWQFQLLRLYNKNENKLSQDNITAEIDWSRALSLEINPKKDLVSGRKTFGIKISEGTGFYLWRVRPIGSFYPGGISDSRNWGTWSATTTENVKDVDLSVSQPFFFYSDTEENINWIYSRVFAEDSKIKESVSYGNGLQQTIQSQVFIPSQNTTVISNSVYDYNGRASLGVLPLPVSGSYLGYKQNFLQASDGKLYSAKNFDTGAGIPMAVSNAGPYNYYQGNTNLRIPYSGEFPVSRTLFYNDGLNRKKEESGVGSDFQIKSDGSGKTVKYFYSTPSETELIKIFGDEAPSSETVSKMTTVDQNNVATVTYTSLEGKVIATSILFNGNSENLDEDIIKMEVKNVATKNINAENGIISTKRLTFLQPTKANVSYRLDRLSENSGCITFNCNYDLYISVYNVETGQYEPQGCKIYKDVFNLDPLSTNPNFTQTEPVIVLQNYPFQKGTYIIEKKLVPLKAETSSNEAEVNNQISPFTNLITGWLNQVIAKKLNYSDFKRDFTGSFINALDSHNILPNCGCLDIPEEFLNFYTKISDKSGYFISPVNNYTYELNTPCCKINIDIAPPPTVCDKSDAATYLKFEKYAAEFLGTCELFDTKPELQTNFYNEYMPGWNVGITGWTGETSGFDGPGVFDAMIQQMIYEPYDPKQTGIDEFKGYYTCEQLFSCWQGLLYRVINENPGCELKLDIGNGTGNPSDSIGKNYESSEGGDGAQKHDSFFDDNISGGFFVKWLAKRKLSKAMRDLQIPDNNGETQIDAKSDKWHLVEEFLRCTGYHFTKIITPFDAKPEVRDLEPSCNEYKIENLLIGDGTLVTDQSVFTTIGTTTTYTPVRSPYSLIKKPFSEVQINDYLTNFHYRSNLQTEVNVQGYTYIPFYNNPDDPANPDYWTPRYQIRKKDPNNQNAVIPFRNPFLNISNPVFAFKYFEYDGASLPEYTALENSTCFSDPNDCYRVVQYEGELFVNRKIDIITGDPIIDNFSCCETDFNDDPALCLNVTDYPNPDPNPDPAIGEFITKKVVRNFSGVGRITCSTTHEYWTPGQRYTFFEALKSYVPNTIYAGTDNCERCSCEFIELSRKWYYNVNAGAVVPYLTETDEDFSSLPKKTQKKDFVNMGGEQNIEEISLLEIMTKETTDQCKSSCENRRAEFEWRIRERLADNCWEISNCIDNPDGNKITEAELKQIVDEAVRQCSSQCGYTSYSCDNLVSRDLKLPKHILQSEHYFTLNLGVAGLPADYTDCKGNNLGAYKLKEETGVEVSLVSKNGQSEFDYTMKKYSFDETSGNKFLVEPTAISWYEYTRVKQATMWNVDFGIENKCTQPNVNALTCPDCPNATHNNGTWVNKSEYEKNVMSGVNTNQISAPTIHLKIDNTNIIKK